MTSQTKPFKKKYFLFNFAITKICVLISLAEDGTRMGGISFQLSPSIIEKSGGKKPTNTTKKYSFDNDKQAVDIICNSYKNHPSILKVNCLLLIKSIIIIGALLQQVKILMIIQSFCFLPALI